ncbi:uncharacterized protein LOC117605645 isoform X1 [Osmia lignaria lignaria]|uniref:uncharacterized protein LOC117605645 isoform X1 n=1 Tax=Osmia lignaria lignaria TaxID=1437193 RepID=UPI00402B7F4B
MSTSTFLGNSDGLVTGLCPAPPPPPPPPPVPGQVPAMRINTVEAPTIKRPQIASNDAYEPPAAIQNAMLTKDKKPFTYTPGMGGKLDLSQIRSPRMARRVAKNANDEGIEGPPKSALEPKPTPAPNTGANLFVQPQVAIPVFPTNIPIQPPINRTPPTPPANKTPPTLPANKTPPITPEKQAEPIKVVTKVDTKATPNAATTTQPSSPESPSTPTQVTLTKAPTPWLQNKNKPQEELPEWAKRSSVNKQSSSPESPTSPPVYASVQQTQPQQQPVQWQQTQQKQQPIQQRPQQQHQQPQQFNQQQQKRPYSSPPLTQQTSPQANLQERVIPIRIEDRPSVFDVKHESGHHQFKQPTPHHQQRWGGPVQNQFQNQVQSPQPQPSSGGTFIIPMMVEGSERKPVGGPVSNTSYPQPIVRNNTPNIENQTVKVIPQRGPVQIQQPDSGPVQSRSFRVLQKITDTDSNDVDTEQVRKLQLSDDDRILMNKFKEQVDNESSLHNEEDPRYRGAAIPSRAFRFLQTMTDSGDAAVMNTAPRAQSAINKKQNRNSKTFEETQANLPPSEQQVPEPKKYMGSAIPSRSFRILQAMTAPESVATQENRQADYTCQTENNVPGNQQGGLYLPPCPPPFWSPDNGWWGYYPLPYPAVANESFPYHSDNTAYVYFPIYNQNYPGYYDSVNAAKNGYPSVYASYVVPVSPPTNNCNLNYEQVGNGVAVPKIDPQLNIPDNETHEGAISKDTDDLRGPPQWDEKHVSRSPSSNSKDSDCTTAMNITDEEEIPEVMVVSEPDANQSDRSEKACTNGSLNVSVPNYTYIDTSDSSDTSDSQSDNESIVESTKSSSDNNANDTSSDSDDSDSYLAYSTGLNPHGRFDDNKNPMNCPDKECNTHVQEVESRNNTDCDSDDGQLEGHLEETGTNAFPHKLSVIYEDVERPDSVSPRPPEGITPFEATDDPPDEADTTTVSVSLPLRFKFSVSENNEDVTTVIVGDSMIKPERPCKDEGRSSKTQEHKNHTDKINEVSANFLVNNDTSADFTVKRDSSESKRRAKSNMNERTNGNKVEKNDDPVVPHVNFTLRKIPTRFNRINCEETVETEFTIKPKKASLKKEEDRSNKERKERVNNTNNDEEPSNKEDNPSYIEETNRETHDFNRNILKPEVIVSECNWTEDPSKETINSQSTNLDIEQNEVRTEDNSNVPDSHKNEEDVEEKGKEVKHLLSVQNSREETDDEDSGVTSDMSRMISEVDTDSECTSSRNIRKYQRTQTHSRLFRLLNDDSILPEGTEKSNDTPCRRKYLSLPLNNTFNYDENYCSNYSSGITSPEYSPVCEQSWRRLHDTENSRVPDQNGHGHPLTRQERVSCKEDPYYQAWKTSKTPINSDHSDVMPSLAFKVLESRRPLWSYRVNVLCPRIKSTKSVPQVLRTNNATDNPLPSNPSPYVNLKSDHC